MHFFQTKVNRIWGGWAGWNLQDFKDQSLEIASEQWSIINRLYIYKVYIILVFYDDTRKLVCGVCEQQKHTPACTSKQSDQHHCYSLIAKYHILICCRLNFNFQANLCSWAGWFAYDLVGNPTYWGPNNSAIKTKDLIWTLERVILINLSI